jgi:hypothetical protein
MSTSSNRNGRAMLKRSKEAEAAQTEQPAPAVRAVPLPADVRETLITCWADILLAEVENEPGLWGDSDDHGRFPFPNRP